MENKEKELLLKDLCGRLPYDTMVSVDNGKYREDMKLRPCHIAAFNNWDIKPYLRPMSSMTEKEKQERYKFSAFNNIEVFDWYNAHHFDYRGLIPMGLALPAPEGMYN